MKSALHATIITIISGMLASSLAMAESGRARLTGTTGADFDKKISRDSTPVQGPAQMTTYADVVQRILPSVVSISTYSKNPKRGFYFDLNPDELEELPPAFRDFFGDWFHRRSPEKPGERKRFLPKKPVRTGLGSGVIITADGYILTNHHVVDTADELKVEMAGRSRSYSAKVIGTDPQTDIALIKIDADRITPATIGDSSKIRVGDIVLAVGSPMGLVGSVTNGIVSGLGRSELGIIGNPLTGQAGYENFIQTDAAINPGNSGGPLLDVQGRVVGLNTAIETRSGMFAGIGLAIPINMAVSGARDLLDGGKVQRGFLGIELDQLDASMAEYLGIEHEGGVLVNSVVPDSPAAQAGFREGDAIFRINDQTVTSPSQLRLIVSANHPGTVVKFGVARFSEKERKPERLELVATLRAMPDKPGDPSARKWSGETPAGRDDSFLPGVSIENITGELRRDYDLGGEVQGVVVTKVEPDALAANVLEEGDVITQVNRQTVSTVAEATARKAEAGEVVPLKILHRGRTKFVVVKTRS